MNYMRYLLFPFSVLYAGIMRLRNQQFNNGSRPIAVFERVIISVGNLSTGGTGKTPMIEYLIQLLKNQYAIATVSRGYGRKTRGERLATTKDSARTLGDEPFQFFRKFENEIKVVVGEERVLAIPHLLMEYPETELLLLDDAFQHRKVARDFNIMLSDFSAPFYKDMVLPAGNLRESRSEAKRANAIIISKCPYSLTDLVKADIVKEVKRYNATAPVFFSSIAYGDLEPVFQPAEIGKEVAVISAIAKPKPFHKFIEKEYRLVEKFEYVDHYNFKTGDLDRVLRKLNKRPLSIVTTEKDMVRLLPFADHPLMKQYNFFYQPIKMKLDRAEEFQNLVIEVIEKRKRELNL